jgi:poly(A) polymerase/tRNA nucleotidyltransferase (CCA-adding enzyme)
MAYEAVSQKLYDPFNGLKDIENKIIQTVGSPIDRFREDGLRPIRACRFAAQLEFSIHPDTLKAITETLDVIGKVSMERIHDELMKLMKAKKPSTGFEYLRQTGVLRLIMPELLEGYQVMQNEYHKYDVYYHNLYTCDAVSRDYPLVRFAAIVHDIGKPRAKNYAALSGNGNVFYNHEVIGERMADRILKRLKFSNSDSSIIKKLVKIHMFYYTEEWTDGAVRRFLRKMEGDMEMLEYLFLLRKADRIGSGMKQGESEILEKFKKRIDIIIKADNALKVTDLDINGDEIMDYFHLKPSKTIGDMLEYMLERVLDNPEYNVKEKLYELGEEFLAGENKGDH